MPDDVPSYLNGLMRRAKEIGDSRTPTTELYFESHITIDPVDNEGDLYALARSEHFRVAELLMKKGLKRSRLDDFLTARSDNYTDILQRTIRLVKKLQDGGYVVRRYKIENTLVDVRLGISHDET